MPVLSEDRIKTIHTISKLTSYDDLNVFSMDVLYDYNLDNIAPIEVADAQEYMKIFFAEVLPGIDVKFELPDFGCSAFSLKKNDKGYLFGRNYDFKFDTSAMVVHCHPKNGFASVAHAALDNIKVINALESDYTKAACLTAPFICLDGINEKGVGIAVLTLDSTPTVYRTGKKMLTTTLAIRIVLDRASSTDEAIDILKDYDMIATCGRDYHFFITDNTGDTRVVEYDPERPERPMIVTPINAITNFYAAYIDKVKSNQKNGIYGHGKERYDAIEDILNKNSNSGDNAVAWEALKIASQEPNPDSITSNTQWSIAYDLNNLSYEFVLHRHWDDVLKLYM